MLWLYAYVSVYWLLSGGVHAASASADVVEKYYESNSFDTYNAEECPRVRRSWYSLTDAEKQQYVTAMLKLRELGQGEIEKDELIAVGSEHMDAYGETAHYVSSYLFWHGYLLWEIESRIRNLGGEYKCFAVPYWDFSTEAALPKGSTPLIFDNDVHHLGGVGDETNAYTVNEYSWPGVSVRDWWVPTHCTAEGDEYPLCSLKRSTSTTADWMDAQQIGRGIIENAEFIDFSKWYSDTFNLPHNLLTDSETLHFPVVTSFDPIWYLFHSMVSYHQGIWQDCHDYDQIAPDELDKYPHAYSEYCDLSKCSYAGDMSLDAVFPYHGMLKSKDWSFVSQQDLTVRKSYHQPRWNVLYDLEDGEGFFKDSGLMDFCKGKLNKKWFVLKEDEKEQEEEVVHAERRGGSKGSKGASSRSSSSNEEDETVLASDAHFVRSSSSWLHSTVSQVVVVLSVVVTVIAIAMWQCAGKQNGAKTIGSMASTHGASYGSV